MKSIIHYLIILALFYVVLPFGIQAQTGKDDTAKLLDIPELSIPSESITSGLGGTVYVYLTVNREGGVSKIDAVQGPGNVCWNYRRADVEAIRRSAEAAAREAKFAPAIKKGKPASSSLRLAFEFPERPDASTEEEMAETKQRLKNSRILNGRAKTLPHPLYPDKAKKARAAGTVQVNIVIDEDGNVFSAEAVSGHELLRPPAIEAACKARFDQTKLDDQAVRVSGILTYNFLL